jgi:hypothetical protein
MPESTPHNWMGDVPVSGKHEMVLVGSVESGAEEWACPTCGRRMLLRWPPHYEKLVLDHGDSTAVHVGGKGGVQVSDVVVTPAPASDVPVAERQWLRENGIDWDDRSA